MALADYLMPGERVAAECGHVAVTNLRLIHHVARSRSPIFREISYSVVRDMELTQRPRVSTIVLGALIAVLSLLAGLGTPLQLATCGLGVAAILLGIIFGDLSLQISMLGGEAKRQRWPLREAGRRESEAMVNIARAAMNGDYAPTPEPPPPPLAPAAAPRSVILLPADDAAGALAALGSVADALCMDLTDLVHPSRRPTARELLRSVVAVASRARRPTWVRVGLVEAEADIEAAAWPGLAAIVTPVESPDDVQRLDALLSNVERERGLAERVRIVVQVESAAGVWSLGESLAASPRATAVIAAVHDALDLVSRPDALATWSTLRPPALPETAHLRGRIAAAATEAGVPLYACLAADVAPGALDEGLGPEAARRLGEAAAAARAHGYDGVISLHPEAVEVSNTAFPALPPVRAGTPTPPPPATWQPVVPSHFGIRVPPREPADAPSSGGE